MSRRLLFVVCALTAWTALAIFPAHAATDARGRVLVLPQPAQRIISLAPSITELLFAAGAGDQVVGVSAYSDYPPPAQNRPIVGTSARLDVERILALRPDLVVAWRSGNPVQEVDRLKRLGITVFVVEPRRLADIPHLLRTLGELAGSSTAADAAAADFTRQIEALQARYAAREPVSVFFQIDENPLLTLNADHIVSDVLTVCGGRNVFSTQPLLVPRVGLEDVIRADPEAILIAMGDAGPVIAGWRAHRTLRAVRNDHLFSLSPDLVSRQSPRLVAGARSICVFLEKVRQQRKR
jgi:iron complex transport system substrate-binding protein